MELKTVQKVPKYIENSKGSTVKTVQKVPQ